MTCAFRAVVAGRVQGVGFRYTTRRMAQQLGLAGWVRNLKTGSVEVWAQGPIAAAEDFRRYIEHGPPGAVVQTVEITDVEPDPGLSDFEVRF